MEAMESVLVVPPSSDLAERLEESHYHEFIRDGHAIWTKRDCQEKCDSTQSFGLMVVPVLDGENPPLSLCDCRERPPARKRFSFFVSLISFIGCV